MAEVETTIVLQAEDNASDEIADVGKKTNKALAAVKKFGKMGAAAFKGFAIAATGVNQAMEVFAKFREMATAAIEKSLEFRSANDPLVQSFSQIKDSVNSLIARMGDVLLNVFVALGNQFAPIIERSRDFLAVNQQVLAIGLVEFFQEVAIAVTKGVGAAFNFVTGVVTTFRKSVVALTGTLLEVAAFFNDDFAGAALEASKEFENLEMKQAAFEERTNSITKAVSEGIGQVSVGAVKALGTATAGLNKPYEKLVATQEKQKANLQTIASLEERIQADIEERAAANLQRRIELTNQLAEVQAEQLRRHAEQTEEAMNQGEAIGDSLASTFTSAYGSAEEGQNRLGAAMKATLAETVDMALASMQKIVTAKAAEAAAGAASSQSGIPIVGPALAAAAAAAMFGLVRGFISMGFQGMAQGGLVQGGISNRDSVPAMLMPGEFVLTKEQTESLRSNGGGGLGGQVTIEMNSQIPAGRAEIKRFVRQNVVPALKDLRNQGMF